MAVEQAYTTALAKVATSRSTATRSSSRRLRVRSVCATVAATPSLTGIRWVATRSTTALGRDERRRRVHQRRLRVRREGGRLRRLQRLQRLYAVTIKMTVARSRPRRWRARTPVGAQETQYFAALEKVSTPPSTAIGSSLGRGCSRSSTTTCRSSQGSPWASRYLPAPPPPARCQPHGHPARPRQLHEGASSTLARSSQARW
jgi:hypothetical protein